MSVVSGSVEIDNGFDGTVFDGDTNSEEDELEDTADDDEDGIHSVATLCCR